MRLTTWHSPLQRAIRRNQGDSGRSGNKAIRRSQAGNIQSGAGVGRPMRLAPGYSPLRQPRHIANGSVEDRGAPRSPHVAGPPAQPAVAIEALGVRRRTAERAAMRAFFTRTFFTYISKIYGDARTHGPEKRRARLMRLALWRSPLRRVCPTRLAYRRSPLRL